MRWTWLGIVVVWVACGACSGPEERPASSETVTPPPSGAGTTRGSVVGKAPAAQPGNPTVIVLTRTGTAEAPAPDTEPVMDQVQLTFVPDVLLARTGHPILFRNSDEEMHNMNVKHTQTRTQTFNVGIPPDASYRYTFAAEGFYDVNCDVHPSMSASILVVSTPFAAVAGDDGSFVFADVPAGDYVLTAYAGKDVFEKPVQVRSERTDVQIGQ
jgi:plastocyanin